MKINQEEDEMVISPLTNESQVSLLDEIPTSRLIADWNNAFSIDITDELKGCSKIELYRCDKTGLKFFMPSTIAGSDKLYVQLQKLDWYYMPWKWEHVIALTSMRKGERILEVGCGIGDFVEAVRSKGFAIEGIELNPAAIAAAQGKKLPVSETTLFDLANQEGEAFDVICSFQVLEHVPDPGVFIKGCISLLKHGGKLILCVPDNDGFLRYQYNILDMPPHHMTQWSLETFRAMEKMFPLRLCRVACEPLASYHVDAYINTYCSRFSDTGNPLRLLLNRYTAPFIRFLFMKGMRHLFRGQSLYIEYTKT